MRNRTSPRSRRAGPLAILIALAVLFGATAPTNQGVRAADDGIGGTGAPLQFQYDTDQGMSGTGFTPTDPDQGVGGTGITAGGPDQGIGGTGIIGVVTGFGSILVNGMTVDFDDSLAVTSIDGAGYPEDLRVGQLVALDAIEDAQGRLFARAAEIRHQVAGPIDAVDHANGRVRVLGQWIAVDTETQGLGQTDPRGLRPGAPIRVSGLRRENGELVATRIDPHPAAASSLLRGTVTRADQGGIEVDGVPVTWSPSRRVSVGDQVQLRGAAVRGRLRAARASRLAAVPFGGRYRRLIVEGYSRRAGGGWRVRGLDVDPGDAAGGREIGGRRVVVDGLVGRNRVLRARALCGKGAGGGRLRACAVLRERIKDRHERLRERLKDRPGIQRRLERNSAPRERLEQRRERRPMTRERIQQRRERANERRERANERRERLRERLRERRERRQRDRR